MLILCNASAAAPSAGYARTFLTQLEGMLGTALDRGVKIISNAGGLNPAGLAEQVAELAARLGLTPNIAYLDGDDLTARLHELTASGHALAHLDTGRPLADAAIDPVTANAYLGGWGIAAALDADADIVICPRVTDASLVVGPAAWWHGWSRTDYDALAGASRPVTSSSAVRKHAAATTPSPTRSSTTATRASRSRRSRPTAAASLPSTTASSESYT